MDSSLQLIWSWVVPHTVFGFNPCFNGFFSSIHLTTLREKGFAGFNPCFNGFFSSIYLTVSQTHSALSFNPCFNGFFSSIIIRGCRNNWPLAVSILVLMDSSLQYGDIITFGSMQKRFNPCFNGFFSSMLIINRLVINIVSFNPCFNGFFSSILRGIMVAELHDSFNPCFNGFFSSIRWHASLYRSGHYVSILVLMDSSLQFYVIQFFMEFVTSFNPCFNGFFSSIWHPCWFVCRWWRFQSLF